MINQYQGTKLSGALGYGGIPVSLPPPPSSPPPAMLSAGLAYRLLCYRRPCNGKELLDLPFQRLKHPHLPGCYHTEKLIFAQVLEFYSLAESNKWEQVGWLCFFFVAFFALAWFSLAYKRLQRR